MKISPIDIFSPRKLVVFIGLFSIVVQYLLSTHFMGVCHSPRYSIIVSLDYTTFQAQGSLFYLFFFLCMFNMFDDNIRKSLLGASIHANVLAYYIGTYLTYVSCIHYLICQKLNINHIVMKINSPDNSFFPHILS